MTDKLIYIHLLFALAWLYIFIETRIYLTLWAFIYKLSTLAWLLVEYDKHIYKTLSTAFVLIVLAGYLYKFRRVLAGKESFANDKLAELMCHKAKTRRIIIVLAAVFGIDVIIVTLI